MGAQPDSCLMRGHRLRARPTEHDHSQGSRVVGNAIAMQFQMRSREVGHPRRLEVSPPPGESVPLRAAPRVHAARTRFFQPKGVMRRETAPTVRSQSAMLVRRHDLGGVQSRQGRHIGANPTARATKERA